MFFKHYYQLYAKYIPPNIEFKGDEIKQAVQKLSDILEVGELRIKVEKQFQKETEEIATISLSSVRRMPSECQRARRH